MVLAVNHPAGSRRDFELPAAMAPWTRAADLTVALDHLAADARFGPLLDLSQVAAAGYSPGGWTAPQPGGLRGHRAGLAAHCTAEAGRDRLCAELADAGVALARFDRALWDGPHGDARMRRVIAMDPGLTWGLTPDHAAGQTAAALLIQLGAGTDGLQATGIGPRGSGLAELLPQAGSLQIAPASHASALPVCVAAGAELLARAGAPPVCDDPAGADRAAVHAQTLAAIRGFLRRE